MAEMTANLTWIQMMSEVPRALLFGIESQITALYICSTMLPARGSVVKLAVFSGLKVFFLLVVDAYVTVFMGDSSTASLLRFTLSAAANGFLVLAFCRVYYGGYARVLLATMVSEMILSMLFCSWMIFVNYLESRDKLFVFYGKLQWMDLLLYGGMAVSGVLLLRLVSPVLKKFRTYRLHYPKLIVTVYLVYFLSVQGMGLFSHLDDHWLMVGLYLLYLTVDLLGMLMLFLIIQRHRQRIRMEQQFLAAQLQLMETQYGSVRKQMKQMDACRDMIDRQMKEILQQKKVGSGRAKAYLESLRAEYDSMRAGLYCNSWTVDAVIYCYMREARVQGVNTDCVVRANCTEGYDEDALARILLLLFHYGLPVSGEQKQRQITLHIEEMLGKLRIEFSAGLRMRSYAKRQVRRYIKDCGGKMTEETGENGCIYFISLPKAA